jgi:aminomethyltransferase
VTDSTATDLKKTPLHALHLELGARMVPFAGYEMPVQYRAGIIAEHRHTRAKAGLFDVSHMGQARLRGDDMAAAFETLVPGDFVNLPVGKMRYTLLLNEQGGIRDDLMVTNGGDHLFLVVNAACKDADFRHIRTAIGHLAQFEVLEDRALLALQGPQAAEVLSRFAPAARHILFLNSVALTIADAPCFITRSGYTGEDGFEISVPADDAEWLARLLLDEEEVQPIGLGARDSLRLEAGLCLWGNDIDNTTTPVEADLAWTVSKRRREEGGFPGADVIEDQLRNGVKRKRVGLVPEGRTPARAHTRITDEDGNSIGEVTSGGFGPTVDGPIAMGYVRSEFAAPGTTVRLEVRGKSLPAKVAKLPFVEHRYYRG